MDELFEAAVGRLAEHRTMGRPGQVPGTRALIPHESDRLVYEVQADTVWILALVHTARRWPPARS
jgi:plasmid stabilization system protein ParE